MRLPRWIAWTGIGILAASACTKAPELPESAAPKSAEEFKSVPELKEVMEGMVEEFAETVWSIADDRKIPKDDEEWGKLDHAAIGLIETFKFLQISNLAKDRGDWQQHSQKLIDTAQIVRSKIAQKDVESVLNTGYDLYEVCSECHKEYYPVEEQREEARRLPVAPAPQHL